MRRMRRLALRLISRCRILGLLLLSDFGEGGQIDEIYGILDGLLVIRIVRLIGNLLHLRDDGPVVGLFQCLERGFSNRFIWIFQFIQDLLISCRTALSGQIHQLLGSIS